MFIHVKKYDWLFNLDQVSAITIASISDEQCSIKLFMSRKDSGLRIFDGTESECKEVLKTIFTAIEKGKNLITIDEVGI